MKHLLRIAAVAIVIPSTFIPSQPSQAANPIPQKWLGLLKTLVETNSGSENAEGLEKIRQLLIPEFEALGFKTTVIDAGDGHKVLSFEVPDAKPKVLLVGHVDTVFPASGKFQKFTETEGKISGPGTIDMKGGVVLMLNVLSEIKAPGTLKKIRVAINDDEETGSAHSKARLKELAQGLPYGLVYEPGLPGAALVTSLSGIRWLQLNVKGKAAHAGFEHQKGVNACVELGSKLVRLSALTQYSKAAGRNYFYD